MAFEYEISKLLAETFQHLAFFCSEKGECALEDVPVNQIAILQDALNEKGAKGWELVQLFFQDSGVIAIWKRKKISPQTVTITIK